MTWEIDKTNLEKPENSLEFHSSKPLVTMAGY